MEARAFTLLVGTDFSPSATRALGHAVALVRRFGGRIVLVHVFTRHTLSELSTSFDEMSRYVEAMQKLEEAKIRDVPPDVRVEVHLRLGHPVRGLLDAIELLAPDLVVVGSHGHGVVRRTLLGSVSQRLARRSPVPVLIVPVEQHLLGGLELDEIPQEQSLALALSCTRCGHLLGHGGAPERCPHCGQTPASWNAAPVMPGPVDRELPAVGEPLEGEAAHLSQTPDPVALFPVAPPGIEGQSVNPELRVRY